MQIIDWELNVRSICKHPFFAIILYSGLMSVFVVNQTGVDWSCGDIVTFCNNKSKFT